MQHNPQSSRRVIRMMRPECPNMECPIIRKHRLSTPRLSDWPERQSSEVWGPRYCGPCSVVAAISCSRAVFACEIREELTIRRQVALLRVHASPKPLTAGEVIPFRIPERQTPPFRRTTPHHDGDRRFACEQHEVPASVRKKGRKIVQPICGSHRICFAISAEYFCFSTAKRVQYSFARS
jgi:hypothetical protein